MNTLFFVALIACVCAVYVTALPYPAELESPEGLKTNLKTDIESLIPSEEHQRYIRSRSYGGRGGYGHGGYGGGRGGNYGHGGGYGRGGGWGGHGR